MMRTPDKYDDRLRALAAKLNIRLDARNGLVVLTFPYPDQVARTKAVTETWLRDRISEDLLESWLHHQSLLCRLGQLGGGI